MQISKTESLFLIYRTFAKNWILHNSFYSNRFWAYRKIWHNRPSKQGGYLYKKLLFEKFFVKIKKLNCVYDELNNSEQIYNKIY